MISHALKVNKYQVIITRLKYINNS